MLTYHQKGPVTFIWGPFCKIYPSHLFPGVNELTSYPCWLAQTIQSFRSMTIGPPILEIKFDLENSRSKAKVKSTPVSPASCWLISLVFHIRASYRLPSLSFYDNRASHSRDTIWPWKFKVKGQGQRYPSQCSVQLTHFLIVLYSSYRLPSLSIHDNRASHSRDTIWP